MDSKKITSIAARLGALGGKSTLKKYGADHFRMLGKKSAKSRKAKAEAKKKNSA